MPDYDCWCVTRYDDVLAVLKDTETFSSKKVVDPRPLPGLERLLPDGHPMAKGLVNTDPPEHTRLRKLAQKAFTPRMVAAYEPTMRTLAEELVDARLPAGSMNVIADFARIFTGRVITGVIGAPLEKAEAFMAWSDNLIMSMTEAPPLSAERELELIEQVVEFEGWLTDFIEDRRAAPRDDYTSLLIHARGDDGDTSALTTHEVLSILTNVISAGLDTTSSLIGLSTFHLLEHRERWERLVADRSLIPRAVEEVLRFDDPIRGIRRDVLADTVVGGVSIPRGSVLYLSYVSAQRDAEVFDLPDTFDLDREDLGRHFGFGRWTHFCLGAPLARAEARVALEVFLDRIPAARLTPGGRPHAMPSKLGAFLTSVELEWNTAAGQDSKEQR
jgi:cytochrome P450